MPFVKRANTHQTHFEDLVLLGPDGLEELNDKIEGTIDTLENNSGRMNLTTKIDGAPAMICWSKYPGYPDNSIALKSFINGPQNALSSVEDINNKYPDENRADMREMLKYGLEIARHIPEGQAWQGDCLFTKNSKREENINGKDYITFQPNKIIYAFSEDNPGYEQIKNADFGIAFHTIYSGEDKHQSFKVDASTLDVPDNIYIMSPALNKPTDTKVFNLDKVKAQFDKLEDLEQKLLSNFEYEDLVNNRVFMGYWNTFENANLADKKSVTINENTFIDDLKEYINTKRTKEYETQVGKLKTDAGKEKAKVKYQQDIEDLQELIETNKSLLTTLVQTLNCAATLKMLLWQGFKQTQFGYDTFYRSRTKGYLPGEMEGVAMSDQDGNIVKIVDRSTFSSYNRDPDIMSGFEHPENLTSEQLSFKENYNDELVECGTQQLWEKFNRLLEAEQKTAVIAFGRMNPPTIGHQKLVDTMASLASGNEAKLYLSHTQDKKKNPLSYEDKIYFAKKAFEPKVEVVESPARTVIEVLTDLYSQGYTDIIYVGGEDRIGGAEDISSLISQYNGQPDKKGNILYDFNSIDFKSAGARSDDSEDLVEKASASLARRYATENDFDSFKEIVPFDEAIAKELFDKVKSGLGINEAMKILKEDENKEKVFNSKRDLTGVNSISGVYQLIIDELNGNVDENTMTTVKSVIKDIEDLTNSLDINTVNRLNQRLQSSDAGLTANQFIKTFNPSTKDLDALLKNDGIKMASETDLSSLGLSPEFVEELIKFKGGDKKSTTNVGPYEFAMAILYKGGSMKVSGGNAGDISIGGKNVEVKGVNNPAAVGVDIGGNMEIIGAFDDYVFNELENGQKNKTRYTVYSNTYHKDIDKSTLPKALQDVVGNNGNISFEDLFNSAFTRVIENYTKRFDYLAVCKKYKVDLIPSNEVPKTLLDSSKYSIVFADYVFGRCFKIKKK